MYRIALSYQDEDARQITPRHRDTALTVAAAIGTVRALLPGVDLSGVTEGAVSSSIQRINDFRCDVAAPEGGVWRVVIAPML